MSHQFDASRIATRVALAAAAKYPCRTTNVAPTFDGKTFEREYFAAGGDISMYGRTLREYELLGASDDYRFGMAVHHIQEAIQKADDWFTRSHLILGKNESEPKSCCNLMAAWAESIGHRVYPACKALEICQIDPYGTVRATFEDLVQDYSATLFAADMKTAHLGRNGKWQARLRLYQEAAHEWYEEKWCPFVADLISGAKLPLDLPRIDR
jgi:hypothetical protein